MLLQFGSEMVLDLVRARPALQVVTLDLIADLDINQGSEHLLQFEQDIIWTE